MKSSISPPVSHAELAPEPAEEGAVALGHLRRGRGLARGHGRLLHGLRRGRRPTAMAEADVIINIHKGAIGYGIYFAQKEDADADGYILVTKLDKGSEAEKAAALCLGVSPREKDLRTPQYG